MTATQGGARPSVIVISDWLANCRSGQWTPFEAATALKGALAKEGYAIVDPSPDSKLEAYRKALEPFAVAADYYDDANLSPGELPWRDGHPANPTFKVGQLRAARKAFTTGARP